VCVCVCEIDTLFINLENIFLLVMRT
jgi:hypothetical protein